MLPGHEASFKIHRNTFLDDLQSQKWGIWQFSKVKGSLEVLHLHRSVLGMQRRYACSVGKEWHHRYITPCYPVKDKSDQRRVFSSKVMFLKWGATTDHRKGPFYQIKTNLLHEDNAWFDLQSTEVFTLLRILEEILNSQESWHSTAHSIKHPSKYV